MFWYRIWSVNFRIRIRLKKLVIRMSNTGNDAVISYRVHAEDQRQGPEGEDKGPQYQVP